MYMGLICNHRTGKNQSACACSSDGVACELTGGCRSWVFGVRLGWVYRGGYVMVVVLRVGVGIGF